MPIYVSPTLLRSRCNLEFLYHHVADYSTNSTIICSGPVHRDGFLLARLTLSRPTVSIYAVGWPAAYLLCAKVNIAKTFWSRIQELNLCKPFAARKMGGNSHLRIKERKMGQSRREWEFPYSSN